LIESSSLYADDREPAKIKELINIIFKGVIWKNIFYQFGNLFRDTLGTRNDKKGFDKLSKSLMNAYPDYMRRWNQTGLNFLRNGYKITRIIIYIRTVIINAKNAICLDVVNLKNLFIVVIKD
jgi:hypothetical protein